MSLGKSLKKTFKYGVPGLGLLTGENKTQEQVPLQTEAQKSATQALLDFSKTGKFGSFTAGEDLGLGLGDYGITAPEQTGLSNLQGLLAGGTAQDKALNEALATDPNAIAQQFDPFKMQVQRQIGESNAALKRGSGFAGNLYSTNTVQRLGDIQARGNETLTSKLADLYNEQANRRLSAVPIAENVAQGRIAASQNYGDLTRKLNDQMIKARDSEILRRRQELQLPITAAGTVAGNNAQWGVPSISYNQPSPYNDLLQLLVKGGAAYAGAKG